MFKAFGFLFFLITITACSEKQEMKNSITELEQSCNQKSKSDGRNNEQLLNAYNDFVNRYPDDKSSPEYLLKAGNVFIKMEKWDAAALNFEKIIKNYSNTVYYEKALILAATSYENAGENFKERIEILYKTYLKKFPDGQHKNLAEFYFKPEDVKLRSKIAENHDKLFASSENGRLDRHIAYILLKQYAVYYKKYPQSEFSPVYCFEGGKLASTMGESFGAIEFWLTIFDEFRDNKYFPETILLLAVEYENKMPLAIQNHELTTEEFLNNYPKLSRFNLKKTNWIKESEKMYKYFLRKFPKHPLAEQAKSSLKYLGKTPNEVVNEFKKNNKIKEK